jgi:flagella basal body P-ring formation protein FlgA
MDMRDRKVHTLTGSAFLDVWRALPCAKRPLNRNEPLRPQDITFKRKNIAYVRHDVWDGKGGPWRMSRSVGEGQVIYSRNIEPLPVICEGEEITLKYKGDFIQLNVPALALDDANVGESIKVQNLQSKKRVYGRVKDSKTVVVN